VSNGLSFERVETGRTDTTPSGVQKITDGDGNPEAAYVLYADVEGTKVPLMSKSATFIDGLVKAQQAQQEQQKAEAASAKSSG
jgi:hypothetical protein